MSRYELIKGTSNKFWEIERKKQTLTVRWGRIGTAGSEKVFKLPSDDAAVKQHDKLVAEKVGKGYQLAATKTAPKPKTGWLAKVKPTVQVKGKAGRMFDVTTEPAITIDPAKVEKNLGLPVGPVLRDFIALSEATQASDPYGAFAPLSRYSQLTFEVFGHSHTKIGYGDRPKSLRPFATDHKNVLYFYLSGTSSDDCPVVYESIVDVDEPEIIAADLATYLSQLAFGTHGEPKAEAQRLRQNLQLLPAVTKALAKAELPEELVGIAFDEKPAKALAAARDAARDAHATEKRAGGRLVVGKGGPVSAKDLAKAKKLLEKGDVFSDASDNQKIVALKEALAIVGGATDGEAATLRLEVEKALLSLYSTSEQPKRGKDIAERLLTDWTERGVTDESGWKDLAKLHEDCKIKLPSKLAPAVRRAWATAMLTDFIGDQKTKPKPPKDGKDAYNQARVELFYKNFAKAHACLAIGKRDEHWGGNAECLEVEVLRQEGKLDAAKSLMKTIIEREAGSDRYGHIEWNYLAAVYVALELKDAKLASRMLAAWKKDGGSSSPSLFAL